MKKTFASVAFVASSLLFASNTMASTLSYSPLLTSGESVSDGSGLTMNWFGSAQSFNNGDVLFLASVYEANQTNSSLGRGIFAYDGTETTLIAMPGQELETDIEMISTGVGGMKANGDVFYTTGLRDYTGTDVETYTAVITGNGDNLATLYYTEGGAVNGLTDVTGHAYSVYVGNETVYMGSRLEGGSVTSSDDSALVSVDEGALNIIYREGDTVAGESYTFREFAEVTVNGDDDVVFRARIGGSGVDLSNHYAIYLSEDGTPTELMRSGMTVNGAENLVFSNMSSLEVNTQDQVLFFASLLDTSTDEYTRGLFLADTFGHETLVLSGQAIPDGTAAIDSFTGHQAINNIGQIVFAANLTGTDVDSSNDRALFGIDTDGSIFTIVREGDLYEMGAGVFVTIRQIDFYANSLADDGSLAFALRFSDNTSALFYVNVFADPVPLPAAALFFGTALLGYSRLRRAA